MEYKHYIGVDVSKHTLDFTLLNGGDFLLHERIKNSKADIRLLLKKMMTTYRAGGKRTLFCVECTGTYATVLIDELVRRKVPLWLESPLQIRLSLGLQRGKSDKLDSLRIAQYAYTYRNNRKLWNQPRLIIEHLKQLRSLRERLLVTYYQLRSETKETKGYIHQAITSSVLQHCQASLDAITSDLANVNKTVLGVITADERLNQLYQWITSVGGVGNVLATELLITTNEFKNFTSPKKFACHCGIAPFRYTSGTSTQSKARVSKRANKRMKYLLHMAAMAAIRYEGDYKRYYERRTKQGLNRMSVLNAVRNKIVRRVFACVREQRFYIK
ncbi:MAG TPA: IS110 family transposase [Flavisolibacter sp.]|jgi:transposase|nr:IS110 family transposase [Flavisolibacter sp.]